MHSQPRCRKESGVALLLVMILVFGMTAIVLALSYAMRVETKLATRTTSETELEWIGRSGVEYGKWVLALSRQIPGEAQYDGLNQFWAGGPGPTNDVDNPLLDVSLKDVPLGDGSFSIEIVDLERQLNINSLTERNPRLMELILTVAGAGASDSVDIANSIRDWIDGDDDPAIGAGAESEYYLQLDPPYIAKNSRITDIHELLKIRGVSPALFWGPRSGQTLITDPRESGSYVAQSIAGTFGLVDVFCAFSNGQVNINTASREVLTLACGGNDSLAEAVLRERAGPDGVDGTFDDMPARNPADVARLFGGPLQQDPNTPFATFTSVSTTFEIRVDAQLGQLRRRYIAVVQRANPQNMPTLTFHRE
jgi:general secretion pathway protein K